jgi:hypothetical protein
MPALLSDPAYWDIRAQEARVLANHLDDRHDKDVMCKIAEEYERLAIRAQQHRERATKP